MDKLPMKSSDLTQQNYEKLAALFPNAVTETVTGYDEQGNAIIERAVDADVLRQEISAQVVEGRQQRYQFTWPDKNKAIVLGNTPTTKTLRLDREKSVGRDGTQGSIDTENIYIEGDNLDALKILRDTYLGNVKMIYIDPPYNTGNDFIYEDDFSESGEAFAERSGLRDEDGNLRYDMRQNNEASGRFHTDWLNMMYPRLRLARDLLSDDGVIFISIDDHEYSNLKKMCDELFGESNYISNISWQRTYSTRNDSKGIPTEVEHLLVFGRKPGWNPKLLPRTESMDSKYKNPDNDYALWRTDNAYAADANTHQGMVYAIQHPFTGEMLYPPNGLHWRYKQSEMLDIMRGWCNYELKDLNDARKRAEVCGVSEKDIRQDIKAIVLSESIEISRQSAQTIYNRGQWPKYFFTKNGFGGIAKKTYLDVTKGRLPSNFWSHTETGHTDEAKKELMALFDGRAPFDTPKPVRLMERILSIATEADSIVMDFFSGSASMAHAVLAKNTADHGKRKFIMVQIPESSPSPDYPTLCDIGEERIRRAGKKIKDESPKTTQDLDVGFRVFRVDDSNMKDVYYRPDDLGQIDIEDMIDNIKPDRTPEDLLFQTMLSLGVFPSSKIEEITVAGKKVFDVADGFLLACFDSDVNDIVVTEIAKRKPSYAVFRDSGFADDAVSVNFDQIFREYSPNTERKVL
ncbi:MAG: site-specific DNA-methyltransferase [Oscillospiraceae bacterium]|nr:site-specific DNA-methyltransferase [Oscillospiraceae bacterium]